MSICRVFDSVSPNHHFCSGISVLIEKLEKWLSFFPFLLYPDVVVQIMNQPLKLMTAPWPLKMLTAPWPLNWWRLSGLEKWWRLPGHWNWWRLPGFWNWWRLSGLENWWRLSGHWKCWRLPGHWKCWRLPGHLFHFFQLFKIHVIVLSWQMLLYWKL